MSRIKWNRIILLAFCIALPAQWAATIRDAAQGAIKAWDFAAIYHGARCVVRHVDPYNSEAVLRELAAENVRLPKMPPDQEAAAWSTMTADVYPPTTLLIVAPLALLAWPIAQTIWLSLMAVLMILAAYLAWDLASDAPILAGCAAGFMLLNCWVPFVTGNPLGIIAPLCIIAAWCFLKRRFELAGALLLVLCLVVKPHDVGFVWLYFLLVGGAMRKRALQTLVIAGVLSACAAIWVAPASPNWIRELESHVTAADLHAGNSDPGPSGPANRSLSPVISLQNAASVFRNDPHFYNPVSWLICGGLILTWAVVVLRGRPTRESALLALAAISMLSMLPLYHRAEDAKLLLLAIPACAMLWAGKGTKRWIAFGLTAAAIVVTSDVPILLLVMAKWKSPVSASTLGGKLTLLALQPAPLVLLATGCFYLWLFIRYKPPVGDGVAPADVAVAASAV